MPGMRGEVETYKPLDYRFGALLMGPHFTMFPPQVENLGFVCFMELYRNFDWGDTLPHQIALNNAIVSGALSSSNTIRAVYHLTEKHSLLIVTHNYNAPKQTQPQDCHTTFSDYSLQEYDPFSDRPIPYPRKSDDVCPMCEINPKYKNLLSPKQ